ncbi:MAG: FGGY-family carbohydrate kinase [Clostridiales bacterium]|uniref:xylulokinase n=1 Tax=Chordicoccus furentiruminis TaxID=2709410 RepID=UPI0023A7F330|nr:FGGY-family carbohydrate kinase [Chordicoccus furentiruminis]MCI6174303.1 FGGY-family carbohydrate kinase [Clostridiales bacterium]
MSGTLVLAYDIGTTGVKTCLFGIDREIRLLAGATAGYGLYLLPGGGAEQDAEEWWQAMRTTTARVLEESGRRPSEIAGISFCSQMQGLVLVDRDGVPVHRPMSYMDQRASEEIRKGIAYGPQIAGANVWKLLQSLRITGAVSSSVKDPLWKYKWIEAHEPEAFARAYRWLDVKEYIIRRCTGRFVMTDDSAYATMLYDTRRGHEGWSRELARMFGVRMEHLPEVIRTTDRAGELTEKAAADLGLSAGTPVFGGGGDATLIGIGSGCVNVGQTHIYCGTSGWVSTIVDRQTVDAKNMIAAIVGAQPGRFNYFAEMETAGKCLEWVRNHLALDEIGIYLEKHDVTEEPESVYRTLYDYLSEVISSCEPGAGGVIFTPWLHGNRCPFEDASAAGMFFNIRLETGKTELIRAVVEGICYHLRWMLECEDRRVRTSDPVRFAGGGALSPVTDQILADVTGRTVEVVAEPQDVGAVGAAAVAGVGLGLMNGIGEIASFIPVVRTFRPDEGNRAVYDRTYQTFCRLHACNAKLFRAMNDLQNRERGDRS